MKRSLLIVLAFVGGLTAFAQSTNNVRTIPSRPAQHSTYEGIPSSWTTAAPAASTAKKTANHSKHISTAVFADSIGRCSNTFGLAYGVYQAVWADPRINSVSVIHRSDMATNTTDGNTGFLRFDLSTDGGASFAPDMINVGPIYSPDGDPQGPNFSVARYPQGGIYNPAGNTIADSAYVVYFAPTRDNSNPNPNTNPAGDWGGIGYGVKQIGQATGTQHQMPTASPYFHVIPEGFTIKQSGVPVSIEAANDQSTGNYTGNMLLYYGNFNTSNHDMAYTPTTFPLTVDSDNNGSPTLSRYNVGFSPDGQTGYMVALGHNSGNADSTMYPIVYNTYNGGTSWVGPLNIVLDNIGPLCNNSSATSGLYVSAFSVDVIVDNSGNLHMITPVFGQSGTSSSILIGAGAWGMFDIYTTDGGVNWRAHLLANPSTFDATFGQNNTANPTITEYTRGQATSTWDGTKLFFTWFDTDTIQWGSAAGNATPDMHSVGYNTSTQTWTPDTNFTSLSTNASGQVTFGLVSQYAFSPTGYYNIPCAYNQLSSVGNTGTATQLFYIQNANFTDANFTIPQSTNTLALTSTGNLNGINEINMNEFSLNTYPNPATNNVQVSYLLKKNSKVTIELMNILGEKVSTIMANETQSEGFQTKGINIETLSAGVYMLKTTINDKVIVSKITKI